ncbi:MAG: DUF72 domain-containing protein [Acidobacteria bacterium]|nr:DUF72 domain-containing protein [Acidobacteriota bacterium]
MPDQLDLFGTPPAPKRRQREPVGPAAIDDAVRATAASLPPNVRIGTSSWSFPGWAGLVYDRKATTTELSRHGLAPYAKHPLFRAVGVDRSFYGPVSAEEFAGYAESVPDGFRFLVKAAGALTTPWLRVSGGTKKFEKNERFLDADFAARAVIAPVVHGLGGKAGPLVFQFTPLGREFTNDPARFTSRLHAFLEALPRGSWYAVEIRDPELLTDDYVAALEATGATHCLNVHGRMPSIAEQAERTSRVLGERVAVRWMLHSGFKYEEAKNRYEPFDRLVDEDLASREQIAGLAVKKTRNGVEVIVIANNKAEGCSPESLRKLAEEIVRQSR